MKKENPVAIIVRFATQFLVTLEMVNKYGSIINVTTHGINPALGKKAAAEVERCAKAGLRGVGELHPHCQSYDLGNYQTMAPIHAVVVLGSARATRMGRRPYR